MVFATTRSSRFFVVLLHLVGVSTNLGRNHFSFLQRFWNETLTTTGTIQGVNPSSIPLEITDTYSPQNVPHIDELLEEPHWLQDASDQKCLGPMSSWAECGDSTLWRIIPSSKRHARRRQWIRWATEEDESDNNNNHTVEKAGPQAYAIQLVDDSIMTTTTKKTTFNDITEKECLSRRRKDNTLVVVPCSQDRAWFWKINEFGILYFDKPVRGTTSKQNTKKRLLNKRQNLDCLWRNASEALISSCDGRAPSPGSQDDMKNGNAVQIQLVRQARNIVIATSNADSTADAIERRTYDDHKIPSSSRRDRMQKRKTTESSKGHGPLPSQVDMAHMHASASSNHTEPRSASRMTSILPHRSSEMVARELPRFLKNTNPILVASKLHHSSSTTSTDNKQHSHALLHDNLSSSMKPVIRKIQVNPYIAGSKDERWTDPQTGLVYHTDLCRYLGHERKDAGRHTLTGVGQYTKTMLNIKVSTG
jgi:hypothetical protein